MCENCIELDPGTISGIVVADVIITILIAVAVYCVSGSERGRSSRGKYEYGPRSPSMLSAVGW